MSSGPAHRVSSAAEQYGFPNGHLGHLTPEEEHTLKVFKEVCHKKGFYTPADGVQEYGSHDDATLLRFLRARRFVVQDAFVQFKDTELWRKATELDKLYENIDLEEFDETRKLYPMWTGRRDRRGMPVYVFEIRHLTAKRMADYDKAAERFGTTAKSDGKTSGKLLRLFALYEHLTRFVLPLCSALTDRDHPNTPITQSSNIVDVSGVSLKMFWNLKSHMQDASNLATAHYPETLDRIFIIGAPVFFSIVWGWIKRWFDPITTSKIFILSQAEVQSALTKFIDPANVPKKYGGLLDYEFGQPPVLDPAVDAVMRWNGDKRDFPHGPLYWLEGRDHIELTAVGYVNGERRHEILGTIHMPKDIHNIDEKMASQPSGEEHLDVPGGSPKRDPEHPTRISLDDQDATACTPAIHVDGAPMAVESGELVPASRPEPTTFTTARDGLEELTLKENGGEMNGAAIAPEAVEAEKDVVENREAGENDSSLKHNLSENTMMEKVAQAAN